MISLPSATVHCQRVLQVEPWDPLSHLRLNVCHSRVAQLVTVLGIRQERSALMDTCINHTTTQEQGTSQKRRWKNCESQRLGKSVVKWCLPNMAGYRNCAHNSCGYQRDQHRKLFFLSFPGIGTPIFFFKKMQTVLLESLNKMRSISVKFLLRF